MVLLGLGTTWGCTQWLHREDYTVFERTDNPDGKVEGASVASSRVRASADEPSQYWLIGFKDRRLEREYLEDLVDVSSSCFFVGSALTLLLYLILPLAFSIGEFVFLRPIWKEYSSTVPVDRVLDDTVPASVVGGLGIVAAFIVCCAHLMGKWKVRKDVILYVIEGGYLLYTGALIYAAISAGKGMRPLLLSLCTFARFADTLFLYSLL